MVKLVRNGKVGKKIKVVKLKQTGLSKAKGLKKENA